MYDRFTDEVLTDLLKKDDALALETLFNRYYKPLCQFCYVYIKDYSTAEELVADLFIRLWDNRRDAIILKVRNYLFVSARNLSLNQKQKKKSPIVFFEEVDMQQCNFQDANTPFTILSNRESDNNILTVIDRLPARQREILLMSRIDNMDKQTIAEILGIAVRTVETTLYQAMQHLNLLLKDIRNFSSGS